MSGNSNLTGKVAEKALVAADITANKNTIPNDPHSPFVSSGLRLGTPAATTRGLKEDDFDVVAEIIAASIKEGSAKADYCRKLVKSLTDKYPLV